MSHDEVLITVVRKGHGGQKGGEKEELHFGDLKNVCAKARR